VSVTLTGACCRERDTAATYTRWGRLDTAETFDVLVEELPDEVEVRVGHGGERIGRMVWGEIDDAGQVNVVAVVDDDTILEVPGPVYWSADLLTAGRGITRRRAIADVAALTGLAVTTATASHGLSPIRVRRGDLRSSSDRAQWPLSWRTDDPLLRRAVDGLAGRRHVTRLQRRADERPLGPLMYGPPGRVLSVR